MADDEFVARLVTHVPGTLGPKSRRARASDSRVYDADVYGWALDQARHIRAGRYDLIDATNVADEIESVAKQEFNALVSDLVIVLRHMLKWDHQIERRSRSWALSIAEHRDRLADTLVDNPSLKPRLSAALERAYRRARKSAAETDLRISTFPTTIPYSWTDVVERPFVHGTE